MDATTTDSISLRDRLAEELGLAAVDTVIVSTDYENNSEEWWDNARRAIRKKNELSTKAERLFLDLCQRESVVTDRLTAHELFAWGATLDGWDDGPEHAPYPLVVCESDGDE